MISPTEAAEIELLRAECSSLVTCEAAYHFPGCAFDAAPDDLTAGNHNRPARPGEPAYLLGNQQVQDSALLHGLHGTWGHGVAILCWLDGDAWRGQAFRADHITSNPKVARASRRTLRENGWNIT